MVSSCQILPQMHLCMKCKRDCLYACVHQLFPMQPAVQSQGLRSASLLAPNNQRKELRTCLSKGLCSSCLPCLMFISFPVSAWTLCHTIQLFIAHVIILARIIEPYTGIFQNKIKRLLNTALSQCRHSFSMILSILIVALIAASVWSASRARVRNDLSLYIHVMLVCTRASVRPPGGMLT